MTMTSAELSRVSLLLFTVMQASIVVPMAVVWGRRRHFARPVKLLSWYVYLSLGAVVASRLLYPGLLPNNYGFLIGFNLGKIGLFAGVYRQVLTPGRRRLVGVATGLALVGAAGAIAYDLDLAVTVCRVAQCAVLAGFALVYLDQTLGRPAGGPPPAHDPLWLLSVGQLLYSAGTVTAFSLDALSKTAYDQAPKNLFIAASGLVFNCFLTLAYLRARPDAYPTASPNRLARP